ncbi:MAG: DNA-directed DNA polymerase II small subunit [Candidatus Bathyarchaeia archaeon]
MSERLKKAVETIVLAGYQVSKDAFDLFKSIEDESYFEDFIQKIIKEAEASASKPFIIDAIFLKNLLKEGEKKEELTSGLFLKTPFAKEIESKIEILDDPTDSIDSSGSIDDFMDYFRDRFKRMTNLLQKRNDAKSVRTLEEALDARINEKVKFVCMVLEKKERRGIINLKIDDLEHSATVMVIESGDRALFEKARATPLDQVVCIEGVKWKEGIFVAKDIILPDLPERKINNSPDPIYAALVSDIHVGSKTFLEKAFNRFLSWLNLKIGTQNQVKIAEKIKYVIIAGDLVDGIGVYPNQEKELAIPNLYEQYRLAASFLEKIPDYIEVILIPGNHDAVRQALPQPAIPKDFAEPVYEARPIISLGNPAQIKLHDVRFLLYHGKSLDDVIASIPKMNFHSPEKAMEFLLKCRHLAPEFGKRTSIAPRRDDCLIVQEPPDVFQAGHIHVTKCSVYRGSLVVNCGAWQSQTEYQRRMGLEPTPGILPVLNLHSMQVSLINFML